MSVCLHVSRRAGSDGWQSTGKSRQRKQFVVYYVWIVSVSFVVHMYMYIVLTYYECTLTLWQSIVPS